MSCSRLWEKVTNILVSGKLRLGKNASIVVTNADNSESKINLLELAALDNIAASDLAKIDGITNGTGAVGKALVLDSSGNVAMPDNGAIALSRAAVTAAGSDATNATVLADQVNAVTASDGAKGVALPAAATTTGPILVINTVLTSGANLLVYPVNGGNDAINGGAEDAAFTMGPGKAAWFIPTSATQWYVEDAAGVLTTTAEANYLDITTLGTGAASKAVVLDASGNYSMPDNGSFGLSRASVAAAGSDATNAAVLADQVNVVTAADGATGVALPAAATTIGPILVINTVQTADLKVYPVNGGNDTINGGAEDVAVLLRPGRAAWFIPTSATAWFCDPSALTFNAGTLGTEAGAGITGGTGTIYRSSVVREGGIIRTSILLDLTGLSSSTTDLDIIGQGASVAHIGRITAEHNGTILSGRITCLEAPAGGVTDIDLYSAAEGTGVFDGAVGDLTETAILTAGSAWTLGEVQVFGAVPAANEYLYLTGGAAGTAAAYTAGKFLIEMEGYDA